MSLHVLMLAHGQAATTASAIDEVERQLPGDARLLLLDNGSSDGEAQALRAIAARRGDRVNLRRSEDNLGFAGGMNLLVAAALADPGCDRVLLLNNDALLCQGALAALLHAADHAGENTMVAARMLTWPDAQGVDNLGIALYRSGLASNRKHETERLLGPTGGCMLLSRKLLLDLHDQHGYWFDPRFFCYAEDTDLVMRARWLGYDCAFATEAAVLHHGSLSSGGPDNEFVLYHGIRNSIWALLKNAPAGWLLLHLPWIAATHVGVWLRNLRKGRARTLWKLYRDAFRGLPAMWRERRRVRRSRRVPTQAWTTWVEPRLYDRTYLRRAWRELLGLKAES